MADTEHILQVFHTLPAIQRTLRRGVFCSFKKFYDNFAIIMLEETLGQQQRLVITPLLQAFFMQWYRYNKVTLSKPFRHPLSGKRQYCFEYLQSSLKLEFENNSAQGFVISKERTTAGERRRSLQTASAEISRPGSPRHFPATGSAERLPQRKEFFETGGAEGLCLSVMFQQRPTADHTSPGQQHLRSSGDKRPSLPVCSIQYALQPVQSLPLYRLRIYKYNFSTNQPEPIAIPHKHGIIKCFQVSWIYPA